MRNLSLVLALAALAAATGKADAAVAHGTPVRSGDRVTGFVDSTSDRDLFRFEAPEGACLTVVAKAAAKSGLQPNLELRDPSGASMDLRMHLVGLTGPEVSIPAFGITETGTWIVGVSGHRGTTGAYGLLVRVVLPKKTTTTVVVPSGATVHQPFAGVDGAKVSYTVVEEQAGGIESAGLVCPASNPIPGTEANRKGTRLSAKGIVLGRGGGLYGVEITSACTGPTTVEVTVVVKAPKAKTRSLRLGEEPRPSAISPSFGCNGQAFTVTGTGFKEGAAVAFGDSALATEVVVVSSTEIRGRAPECDASRDGASVPVSVLNPDGQFGAAPAPFVFVGVPLVTGMTPRLSPLEGGVTVSLAGLRFRPGYAVEVDGVAASVVTHDTATHLSFVTPPGSAGVKEVVVIDEYGRPSESFPGLWYSAAPAVESATPDTMSSLGGVEVHLHGSGLVPGVRVFVGGREAEIADIAPPLELTFVCPPGRAGPVAVEVRDPLGRSFTGDLLTMSPSLQDGTAGALPAAPFGTDFRGRRVEVADFNGDGAGEILLALPTPWTNPVTKQAMPGSFLLLNDGSGRFTDETSSLLPNFNRPGDDGQADATALGDLDGDGTVDAVLVRAAPLPSAIEYTDYYGYKAYYDINFPTTIDNPRESAARLLVNDGSGRLTDVTASMGPDAESTPAFGSGERWQGASACLGDLDGDGDGDLILVANAEVRQGWVSKVTYTYTYNYYYYPPRRKDKALLAQEWTPKGAFRVLFNEDGRFVHDSEADPWPVEGNGGDFLDDFRAVAAATGDLNGDGLADAVILSAGPTLRRDGSGGSTKASGLRILFNRGGGTFAFFEGNIPEPLGVSQPYSDEWWQGTSLVIADLDEDGDLDIAVGRPSVREWVDDAGKTHLVPALLVFRNDGAGGFSEDTTGFVPADLVTKPTASTLLGITGMAAVDLDGNGTTDLVLTGKDTLPILSTIPGGARMATRVLLGDGETGLHDATADWLAASDLLPADALAVGDIDADGTPDLVLTVAGDPEPGKRGVRVLFNR